MDSNHVQQMLQSKQAKLEHFNNITSLLEQEGFNQLSPEAKALANQLFDVKSSYFKAKIEVQLGERKRQMTSYLMRKNDRVHVYGRSLNIL